MFVNPPPSPLPSTLVRHTETDVVCLNKIVEPLERESFELIKNRIINSSRYFRPQRDRWEGRWFIVSRNDFSFDSIGVFVGHDITLLYFSPIHRAIQR